MEPPVAIYRERFEPSKQLTEPYVIAGINGIVADSGREAEEHFVETQRRRAG